MHDTMGLKLSIVFMRFNHMFVTILLFVTTVQATLPPQGPTSSDNNSVDPINKLEKKIHQLEMDRYLLSLFNSRSSNDLDDVKVVDDSLKIQDVEKYFRRVTLAESNYDIGWVVDGNISACMLY